MEVTHDKHFKVDERESTSSSYINRHLGQLTDFSQSPESDPQIICMEEDDDELLSSLHLS